MRAEGDEHHGETSSAGEDDGSDTEDTTVEAYARARKWTPSARKARLARMTRDVQRDVQAFVETTRHSFTSGSRDVSKKNAHDEEDEDEEQEDEEEG